MQHRVTADKFRSGSERLASLPEAAPRRYRLAAIFHRPRHYFCDFVRRLAAHPAVDLAVFFYSDMGVGSNPDLAYGQPLPRNRDELLAGYRHCFLRNLSPWPELGRFTGMFHPSILWKLDAKYDAVLVHGWWGISSWLAYFTTFARHIPLMVHSDRNVVDRHRWRLQEMALRTLFKKVAAFLIVGKCNADYYRRLGVSEGKMFFTPFAVDNAFYREEAQRLAPKRRELRRRFGILPEEAAILYVGRLSQEKGLLDLLAAFNRLGDVPAHVVLVGDGPQRPLLEEKVRSEGSRRVHFVGSVNYTEISSYYILADVFVLPSHHEPWGAVVNEAMNFSLPVVASENVAAAADLVKHGRNGFILPAGDVAGLARHLEQLVSHAEMRREMGRESLKLIAEWNLDQSVEGVVAALRAVISPRSQDAKHNLSLRCTIG
jgi:glycosyltransferase involved in cell wall biosynthesis